MADIDIVDWLRREAELVALDRLGEAADEIERLRKAGYGGLHYDLAEKQRQEIEQLRRRVAELEKMEDERESREGWLR